MVPMLYDDHQKINSLRQFVNSQRQRLSRILPRSKSNFALVDVTFILSVVFQAVKANLMSNLPLPY